ncbi:hypothetical protein PTSG_05101 [Salpingoeca rosetta]|uniref:Uncharacterized protein n=1 Tax=Salpingoeca rosetta (strain ATCC 50818 / BSB-021) TaxID=946362 RepID=F2UAI9_SALR5|nr:uncharacterized protein PTSG_05101 [Salpingoeca rosetta]EGD73405.1 hypothetical protein PTSG_05101 [Salpingoeca rosetta]|eukprot:XP_004993687.1 hypothetical protein PTSG_05101 [Salpingoeca rosetta]
MLTMAMTKKRVGGGDSGSAEGVGGEAGGLARVGLQYIAPAAYRAPMTVVPAVVACIPDKKKTSTILRSLQRTHPLHDLKHCRRVRFSREREQLEVIVCGVAADVHGAGDLESLPIDDATRELVAGLGLKNVHIASVPAFCPLTRTQMTQASQYWPVTFHENREMAAAMDLSAFTPQHMEYVQLCVKRLRELAGKAAAEDTPHPSTTPTTRPHHTPQPLQRCAIAADPRTGALLHTANDQRHAHPLHHEVMMLIDQVARARARERAAIVTSTTTISTTISSSSGVGAAIKRKADADSYDTDKRRHGGGDNDDDDDDDDDAGQLESSYLLKGLDVFLTHEPCIMCSMALVHSRVGRIFFETTCADGAISTNHEIHQHDNLNHRFDAFAIVDN